MTDTLAVDAHAANKGDPAVHLASAYALNPRVSLRPEPFGALAYHFGNRRLSFLRSPDMVRLVEALADHPTLADALDAVGIEQHRWPSFQRGLATLIESDMVVAQTMLVTRDD